MGIPHGEPLRREIRSEKYTWPGQNGVLAIDGPHPGALSLELLCLVRRLTWSLPLTDAVQVELWRVEASKTL